MQPMSLLYWMIDNMNTLYYHMTPYMNAVNVDRRKRDLSLFTILGEICVLFRVTMCMTQNPILG